MRVLVPRVLEYNGEDCDCSPVCENEYYEDILLEVLGDYGYEVSIVDVVVGELYVIIITT